jgi:hypothetical protein
MGLLIAFVFNVEFLLVLDEECERALKEIVVR